MTSGPTMQTEAPESPRRRTRQQAAALMTLPRAAPQALPASPTRRSRIHVNP